MPCGCSGAESRRALTVTVGATASVQRSQQMTGMPRYRVLGSAKGDQEFDTWNEARVFKAKHGGKVRAV